MPTDDRSIALGGRIGPAPAQPAPAPRQPDQHDLCICGHRSSWHAAIGMCGASYCLCTSFAPALPTSVCDCGHTLAAHDPDDDGICQECSCLSFEARPDSAWMGNEHA